MLPSAVDLARFQFAFVVVWHFLFPAFTIGLASYLAVLEGLWLATGRAVYLDVFRYWLRIFAIAFAMGVVSGIVMSYQFGTNWSVFSDKAGNVIGPLLGYEVLTAFFLEAGFLGVMLFGMQRVGKGLHFVATCIVAGGTLMSAFWILSANSWMQTPLGYSVAQDGRFMPESWFEIIFNPSFPFRFAHTVTAAYLTTALAVGAVGAYHLLRDSYNPRARVMFSMAMWMAATATSPMVTRRPRSPRWKDISTRSAAPQQKSSVFPTRRRSGSITASAFRISPASISPMIGTPRSKA